MTSSALITRGTIVINLRGSGAENILCTGGSDDTQDGGEECREGSYGADASGHALDGVEHRDAGYGEKRSHECGEGLQDAERLVVPVADCVLEEVVGLLFLENPS